MQTKLLIGGVILSDDNQSLSQSYLTAKHVFERVERGTIKFVLIGLTPDCLCQDNKEELSNFQQIPNISTPPVKESLSFDEIKKTLNRTFSAKSIIDWVDNTLSLSTEAVEKNIQILKEYIELCRDNDAQPVGVVFPFVVAARENYNKEILNNFREKIHQFEESHEFICMDMFDLNLGYDSFCEMTRLNAKGMMSVNAFLSLRLYEKNLISVKSFCDMTYEYFDLLSYVAPKDDYNALMDRVFEASAQLIRRKDKIKVGFVLYDSSTWCGNDLCNFFSQDERFEPTVFLCLRIDGFKKNMVIQKEFLYQKEQLKSNGLNVVALDSKDSTVSEQDLIFYLIPYDQRLPKAFQIINISMKTLLAYIPYSFEMGKYDASFTPIVRVAWKQFLPSLLTLEIYNKKQATGIPQRVYSGYPKIDVFYKNTAEFKFDWKMARPDAKKIIWAPHHSIGNWSIATATIQWNYQFMYEFAKAHPEISWVVKPHSNLPFNAIRGKVFPTASAYEEYMKAWDDLPNAQVYTGAYYQAIFATSDGMIHDCGSFTAEYQYVDKPMIYLTREGSEHNELGNIILNASYLVDGKDLEGIAAMIQRVFIEGDDYKAAERKEVFDKIS